MPVFSTGMLRRVLTGLAEVKIVVKLVCYNMKGIASVPKEKCLKNKKNLAFHKMELFSNHKGCWQHLGKAILLDFSRKLQIVRVHNF